MKKHSHNKASSFDNKESFHCSCQQLDSRIGSSVQRSCSCSYSYSCSFGSSSGNSYSRPIDTSIVVADMTHLCLYITKTCLGSSLVSYYYGYCQSLLFVGVLLSCSISLALVAEALCWVVDYIEIYSCFRMTMYFLSRHLRQRENNKRFQIQIKPFLFTDFKL